MPRAASLWLVLVLMLVLVQLGRAAQVQRRVQPDQGPMGGVEHFGLTAEQREAHATTLPSIVFIKTHKTGSSTLTNILHRMGDWRNLTFQNPWDNTHLGWPNLYPGRSQPSPNHQFDLVVNHMVWNPKLVTQYVKRHPFVFTVLREPLSQAQSAFNYFKPAGPGWALLLQRMEDLRMMSGNAEAARFRNPQAFDLGWYNSLGAMQGATVIDQDDEHIAAWVNWTVGALDLVILTEEFDRGLVLLARLLHVPLQEMCYVKLKDHTAYKKLTVVPPTAAEQERLRHINRVDLALYARHEREFSRRWASEPGAEAALAEFERLNNATVPFPAYKTDNGPYVRHLKVRQYRRNHAPPVSR